MITAELDITVKGMQIHLDHSGFMHLIQVHEHFFCSSELTRNRTHDLVLGNHTPRIIPLELVVLQFGSCNTVVFLLCYYSLDLKLV